MRRALHWLAWTLTGLIATVLLLVVAILVIGNIGPGRPLLAGLVGRVTAGQVIVADLGGRFPDDLTIGTVALRDPDGAYLTLHGVTLDWSPWRLVQKRVEIARLTAADALFARLPKSSGGGSSSLPVRVIVHAFRVGRLELAPAVVGHGFAVSLEGSGTLDSATVGQGQVAVQRLGAGGTYRLDAALDPARLHVVVAANEPPNGLIAAVAGLPELGAITIEATLDGPREAVATHLAVGAGPLRAQAQGTLDLVHSAANLTLSAQAPAMRPRPDIGWQSVALDAAVHGPFDRPEVAGHVRIEGIEGPGGGVRSLAAEVSGNQGLVHLHATADGLHLPGPQPALFDQAPLQLTATARLSAAGRPVEFSLQHPLLTVDGTAQTAGALRARMHLAIPQLAPFAAVAGADLQGYTTLDIDAGMVDRATTLAVKGTIGLNAAPAQAATLLGNDAHLDLAVSLRGQDLTLTRFALDGREAAASVHGTVAGGIVKLDWTGSVSDLAAVQPGLAGKVQARGHIEGSTQDLVAAADVDGSVTAQGISSGPFSAHLDAKGLPSAPTGRLTAQGELIGAPVAVAVAAERQADGATHVVIERADWKSARAEGSLTLRPPSLVPQGKISLAMARLADLAPLVGRPVAGSIQATLDADASNVRLEANLRDASAPGTASVSRVALRLAVADPATHPKLDGELTLDGLAAGGVGGSATLRVQGPQEALALTLATRVPNLSGAAARLDAAAQLDVSRRSVTLSSLSAGWKQRSVRLLAPARIALGPEISVDNLRLAVDRGVLTVNGKAGTALALNATLRDLPADIVTIASPGTAASGTIGAEMHLTGTVARPEGTVRLTASGLRVRSGPGQAMPTANVTATATLSGGAARVDARLTAGTSHLAVTGTAPVTAGGSLNLRATGTIDLAMANPVLTAAGRRAAGQLTIDMTIAGAAAAPRIAGTAQLANGEVQDYTQGLHLRAIAASVQANGDQLRLARFSATAGSGSIGASGTIGLTAPMPVNLTITARNAELLANDILTERLDANLTIAGDVAGNLAVRGSVHVLHADIEIPEKLPASVAVLPISNKAAPASRKPAPAAPPAQVALDVSVDTRQIIIRGRGLFAVLGGTIHAGGTSTKPLPSGGLKLDQGTFSLAGQSLTFSQGSIDFIGAGIADPALNFVAITTGNNVTATLTIGGTVREPKITLTSVPQLPQDEILAQILFHRSVSSLSPFQVAQIAAAIASFSGTGSSLDPLAGLRKSLGLDQLTVGSNSAGSPTVQAGRYVAPGVFVGAQQGASGGSQAMMQIDIARGLKLQTTTGAGGGGATGAAASSNGTSVGLTYQFEY